MLKQMFSKYQIANMEPSFNVPTKSFLFWVSPVFSGTEAALTLNPFHLWFVTNKETEDFLLMLESEHRDKFPRQETRPTLDLVFLLVGLTDLRTGVNGYRANA